MLHLSYSIGGGSRFCLRTWWLLGAAQYVGLATHAYKLKHITCLCFWLNEEYGNKIQFGLIFWRWKFSSVIL